MLASSLFALTGLAVASAFTLPEATDGFYVAYINETGHEVHELLATDGQQAHLPRSLEDTVLPDESLSRRDPFNYWETYCGCGIGLNHADCDAAVADLKSQMPYQTRIEAWLAYYSIRGSVVAFACNLNSWTSVISAEGVTNSALHITENCGWYIAGTAYHYTEGVAEFPYTGYMRYSAGLDFCGHAKGSSSKSC